MKSLISVCILALLSVSAFAETKTEKVVKVLEMTKVMSTAQKVNDAVIQQLSPMFPAEAAPVFEGVSASMTSDEFKGLIVKLYEEFYTESELDAMIAFYSSKEGKSILEKMPKVMQESMAIGNVYGQMQAKKIMDAMKEKGFEPKMI